MFTVESPMKAKVSILGYNMQVTFWITWSTGG